MNLNTIFDYCGWDFGKFGGCYNHGDFIRIGRNIYKVVFRIGTWHLLKVQKF